MPRGKRYTKDQIITALTLYNRLQSMPKVVELLGYPSVSMLCEWKRMYPELLTPQKRKKPRAWKHATIDIKIHAIHRCINNGETVKSVADDIGYSSVAVLKWIQRYTEEGSVSLMSQSEQNVPVDPNDIRSIEDINELKAKMIDMQMEIDILKETLNVLKKDPGVNLKALKNRDFHADKPNQKRLTDITEFSIDAGKVHLSPIIDCLDGMPVSRTVGTSPNAELANTMLKQAITTFKPDEHPIVHSDRGCHYRWTGWIQIMEDVKLTRSMSKKGCSPDNSACEGFFGHMKKEMFYDRNWRDSTLDELIQAINMYMNRYRTNRIKSTLGGLSPLKYRRRIGVGV